jgi:hypothetical protein
MKKPRSRTTGFCSSRTSADLPMPEARDQDELGRPRADHALERGDQRGDLVLAAIELLGNLEAVRGIVLGQGERLDPAPGPPRREAPREVVQQAARRLVTILGHLGEELQDDRGEHLRQLRHPRAGRLRGACDVAMHPFERVLRLEGQAPREHLVERDAQRIEVGAAVDDPVHAPRLLGRQVRQGALDELQGSCGRLLAGEAGGEPEVGELHLAGRRVEEDVLGLQVPVEDALLVQLRHGPRDTDRKLQESLDGHGRAEDVVERRTAEILQDERRHPLVLHEVERPHDRLEVQRCSNRVLVLQALDVHRAAAPRIEHLQDHRAAIGRPDPAEQARPPALVNYLGDREWRGELRLRHAIVTPLDTPPAMPPDALDGSASLVYMMQHRACLGNIFACSQAALLVGRSMIHLASISQARDVDARVPCAPAPGRPSGARRGAGHVEGRIGNLDRAAGARARGRARPRLCG